MTRTRSQCAVKKSTAADSSAESTTWRTNSDPPLKPSRASPAQTVPSPLSSSRAAVRSRDSVPGTTRLGAHSMPAPSHSAPTGSCPRAPPRRPPTVEHRAASEVARRHEGPGEDDGLALRVVCIQCGPQVGPRIREQSHLLVDRLEQWLFLLRYDEAIGFLLPGNRTSPESERNAEWLPSAEDAHRVQAGRHAGERAAGEDDRPVLDHRAQPGEDRLDVRVGHDQNVTERGPSMSAGDFA